MKIKHIAVWILALSLLAIFQVGCSSGGAKTQTDLRANDTAKDLIALRKALDSGAINKDDYSRERQRIIERD
jgi:uncharacterized membrane protein